jgi:hypothetical protein
MKPSLNYLKNAEVAYRSVLEIKTRQKRPHDWALTQNNLGNVLRRLGERTEGAQGLKYLEEAEVPSAQRWKCALVGTGLRSGLRHRQILAFCYERWESEQSECRVD